MISPDQLEMMAEQAIAPMKGMALGAPFMGICFDSLLLGVIICQLTHWIPNAKADMPHIRAIVGIVATAALFGTAFTWATYLTAFVHEYGRFSRFASLEWFGWYGVLDIAIVVPVQVFFAERSVRINGNSRFLIISNATLIAATGVMGIATTISTRGENIFTRTTTAIAIATAWPGVCILTHIWLTSTILYGLYRTRSMSERANTLVMRVIIVSIESQLPSTIVALLIMLVLLIDHKSPLVPFIVLVHPKIFAVGLYAMINLRHMWKLTGKVPTTYSSEQSRRQTVHVSLGSTVDDIGLHTPKADINYEDPLSRQQSVASMMEAGMPLQELTSGGEKNQSRKNPFN